MNASSSTTPDTGTIFEVLIMHIGFSMVFDFECVKQTSDWILRNQKTEIGRQTRSPWIMFTAECWTNRLS